MKTTLEIPDGIFRRAKAAAAARKLPLRQFVTDAVAEKLDSSPSSRNKARLALAGKLRRLHKETVRINKVIESEFEEIDAEDWA